MGAVFDTGLTSNALAETFQANRAKRSTVRQRQSMTNLRHFSRNQEICCGGFTATCSLGKESHVMTMAAQAPFYDD